MSDSIRYGIPLGNVDTAWLHMEDSTNLMMVSGLFIFDKPVDFTRLRDTVQYRWVERFSRFRHKVVRQGNKAYWITDRNFDLNSHIHRIALPPPGDKTALQDFISDLMSTPLDFSKPLWQMHYIENYGEGSVLLMRLHHCIADGIALMHVMLSSTDTDPDAPYPTPPERQERHSPGWLESTLRSALGMVANARKVTDTLIHEGLETLTNPSHALDLASQGASAAAALGKILLLGPDPHTVYKGSLGVSKRVAWSQAIPLANVKLIGKALGGTVNDVLLTAMTGALRRYMEFRDDPTDGINIRAMVPVNLRPLEEAYKLGNRFGLIYLSLPIYLVDPRERLHELKQRMDDIKNTPEALVAFQILNTLGLMPIQVADQMVNIFGMKSSAVMTNVPGPRQAVYFAGQKIVTNMFWVPQSGRMGLGVSIFSYNDTVVLGIATDTGLVPDPEKINEYFEQEFVDLLAFAQQTQTLAHPALAAPTEPAAATPAPDQAADSPTVTPAPVKQPRRRRQPVETIVVDEPAVVSEPAATAGVEDLMQALAVPEAPAVPLLVHETLIETAVAVVAEPPVLFTPTVPINGTHAAQIEMPVTLATPQPCVAVTKSGRSCKNVALAGSAYCRVHQV